MLVHLSLLGHNGHSIDAQSYCLTVMTVTLTEWKQDLATWEESEISDISTIKGIVAELAASIGPDLVQQTMLEFQK